MRAEVGGAAAGVGVIVIHGVGEAELGWINDYLVGPLEDEAQTEGALPAFDAHSEVHKLTGDEQSGGADARAGFTAYVRNAALNDGRHVAFIELLWADLSRVGSGFLSRLFAGIRLFFEAPQVFSDAMLADGHGTFHRALRAYIAVINLWLRWTIAGLNAATLAVALTYGAIRSMSVLPIPVAADDPVTTTAVLLGLSAVASGVLSLFDDNRDIRFAELWRAMCVASVGLLAVLLGARYLTPGFADRTAEQLLSDTSGILLAPWVAWNGAVLMLVMIVGAIALKRCFVAAHPSAPSLQRLAGTTAVIVVQGMIWKITITLIWIFLVLKLVPTLAKDEESCRFVAGNLWRIDDLNDLNCNMLSISLLNVCLSAEILTAFAAVIGWRVLARWLRPAAYRTGSKRLPRLIANGWVVAVILVGYVFNFVVYYVPGVADFLIAGLGRLGLSFSVYALVKWLALYAGYGLPTVTAAFRLVGEPLGLLKAQETNSALHIARDLVDHQFQSRHKGLRRLRRRRHEVSYPRRERIQQRLDALLNRVVTTRPIDRLIFLTHSQGTVIAYDYLRARQSDPRLTAMSRIDVVTLASPLTHIYKHYFPAYDPRFTAASDVHPRLRTWINLWRVDDPIGHKVDVIDAACMHNETLKPGGHVNYWKEDRVCQVVLDMIRDPDNVRLPSAYAG